MDNPKYIIVKSNTCECAIVFNSILLHNQVAGNMKVIAAGQCRLPNEHNPNQVSAWGKSHTLNIYSRGDEDADLIYKSICRT